AAGGAASAVPAVRLEGTGGVLREAGPRRHRQCRERRAAARRRAHHGAAYDAERAVGDDPQRSDEVVKPPKFDYHAPVTLDEALALLVRYGGDAKLLAGGQSLVPLLNFRLARPAALIDLNRLKSLAYIREHDGQLRFGAMTRQRTIEFSPIVARRVPLPPEA